MNSLNSGFGRTCNELFDFMMDLDYTSSQSQSQRQKIKTKN